MIFIPLIDGKMPESPDALNKAMAAKTDAEREQLAKAQGELQDELATLTLRQQEMMRELIDDIRAIERAFAARLITPSIEDLKHHFNNPAVDKYLDEVARAHARQSRSLSRATAPSRGRSARLPATEEGRDGSTTRST